MVSKRIKKIARNTLYSALAISVLAISGLALYQCGKNHRPRNTSTSTLEKKVSQSKIPSNLSEINPSQLTYNPKYRAYKVNGDFELKGLRVGDYSDEDENYLFFDGKEHDNVDLPYISMGESKLVLGVPANAFGSSVQLLPENSYIDIDEYNFVMVQALGGKRTGHMKIEKRAWEGKIPRITSSTGYNIFNGQGLVKYNEEIELKNKGPGIKEENPINVEGKFPIPLHVITTDKIGQRIHSGNDYDLVFYKDGRILAGTGRELLSYPGSLRNGEYTSIRQSFHDLTFEEQEQIRQEIMRKNAVRIQKLSQNREVIPTPEPLEENMQKRDGYEPSMPQNPMLSNDKNKVILNNEEYNRIQGTNRFISPSGKFLIVN